MGEENSGGQQGPFLSIQVECSLFHCQVVYVDLVNKKTTFTDPRLAFAKETVTASSTFGLIHACVQHKMSIFFIKYKVIYLIGLVSG